jgi:very-short-patch-repair endonuclease
VDKHRRGIYNVRSTSDFRKNLRNSLTPVEAILWKNLQGRKLAGKKFRRQFSIGPYIVDFYCPKCRLAIELDGAPHFTDRGAEHDAERAAYLQKCGIRIMRFENKVIREDIENVLELIRIAVLKSKSDDGV